MADIAMGRAKMFAARLLTTDDQHSKMQWATDMLPHRQSARRGA